MAPTYSRQVFYFLGNCCCRLEEFHSGQTSKSFATSGFRRSELPIPFFFHENVQGFLRKKLKSEVTGKHNYSLQSANVRHHPLPNNNAWDTFAKILKIMASSSSSRKSVEAELTDIPYSRQRLCIADFHMTSLNFKLQNYLCSWNVTFMMNKSS